jgi:hypothetical protein
MKQAKKCLFTVFIDRFDLAEISAWDCSGSRPSIMTAHYGFSDKQTRLGDPNLGSVFLTLSGREAAGRRFLSPTRRTAGPRRASRKAYFTVAAVISVDIPDSGVTREKREKRCGVTLGSLRGHSNGSDGLRQACRTKHT